MKRLWSLAIATALVFSLAPLARAEKLPEPKVEYSADRVMETEEMTIKGKVYHAPQKDRSEMSMEGMTQVSIMRRDKKVMWILMPAQKAYMEHAMGKPNPKEQEQPDDMDYEMTKVGEEKLEGLNTTKYKIVAKSKDGTKMGGFMWMAHKEGIMVKMDAIAATEGKEKRRMKMSLQNIKIGKQDSSLFEIPSGFSRMNMPGMMGGGPPSGGGRPSKAGGPPAGMPPGVGPNMTPDQIEAMKKRMMEQYGQGAHGGEDE